MRTTKFFFAAAALSVGAMSMGCELIASVDRSQINPGDTSSSSSSSSSTSSTSTSSGMAGAGGTAGMGGMAGAGGTAGMGGAAGMGGMGGAAGMGGMGGAAGMGGMGGAAGMGGGGGAGGGGMPCQTPSDCPTAPNECVVATCNGGMCGTMFVAAGTSTSSQMAGDCKRAQCNGAGAIVTVNDDADVPVDQKDCTDDVCMAGSPSNPPLMMGTKCGAGMTLVCDGMGNCIGCNQPTDCSGMDTECQTRTCVTGMCGVANTPQGTVLQMQTPNDCKTAICDDMGNTGTTFNGADLPGDDGNACTMAACDMVLGPVQNPVTTNDNDACTTDACDPMTGISHTPVNTNDNNACTTDACDPMTGVSHTPVVIDDNNACTADACDPMTGVSHTPVVVDDGNACTVDACNTMTGAITHDPVNIDDNNVCTVDACNTMTGVSHTPVVIDDGNACTTDACDPMTGISHTAINIDDMVACTADACDPMTGESHITNDSLCGPLNVCDLTGCMPAIAADQVGSVVITEFSALGTEFIELYNPSASPVDIRGYVVRSGTSQPLSIRSATDPTDAMSTPVTIAANGYVWGVVNPSNAVNIPAGAAFVIGAPGATMALGDTGDAISVYGTQGLTLQDTVDFTQFHANETAAMPATAFPGFAGLSTQVEPTLLTATGNDSGANWCTSFYPATGVKAKVADTKGAGNGSCKVAVVNEAFIDPSATDDGKAFIEIAGPGGGLAAGMKLDDIEGTTAPIGVTNGTEMVIPAGTRIPVDGILLVADELGTTGTTQVPGFTPADVIVNDVDYENNGGDAIQLISANNVLLDVVGHSPSSTNFTSNTAANGYAMYEAQVAAYPPSNSSLARNATNTDTDHNGNDFHGDPSPTPGIANDLVNFTITSLTPDDGLANIATTGITVFGTDLAGGMTLAVGGNAASTCAYVSSTQMTCTAPTNNGTVARVGITATNQASVGAGTFSLPNSFTYTGVLNELGVAGEADFCNVQFPTTFTVTAGQATPLIFGRIFEDTVTQPAGAPTGVLAELGYGPAAWTPLSQNSTTGFMTAPFNTQVGNDDEFQISFVAPIVAGMYRYVYRFSLDGGLNYTYCDTDGAGSNTGLDFNEANAGLMTVQ